MSSKFSSLVRISVLSLIVSLGFFMPDDTYAQHSVKPSVLEALMRDFGLSAEQAMARIEGERAAMNTISTIRDELGIAFGGAWIDLDRNGVPVPVVAVAESARVAVVREAGARPAVVEYSLSELTDSMALLNAQIANARLPMRGVIAWSIDVRSNAIEIQLSTESQNEMDELEKVLAASGVDLQMVNFVEVQGRAEPFVGALGGGRPIFNQTGQEYCSRGFNVVTEYNWLGHATDFGYTTAGHCVWSLPQSVYDASGDLSATITDYNYPGSDNSLAEYDFIWFRYAVRYGPDDLDTVWDHNGSHVYVVGEDQAPVGASICKSGYKTDYTCGTIDSLNASANYGDGWVTSLIQVDACAGQGDSGGATITPSGHAQGMISGGVLSGGQDNNCSQSNPVTWLESWLRAKQDLGVDLYY